MGSAESFEYVSILYTSGQDRSFALKSPVFALCASDNKAIVARMS